jgi:ribosomal protein L11 methyltransferase
MTESWLLTLPCTADEARAAAEAEIDGVVLATSEPDPAQPDVWQLDAYFEGKPSRDLLKRVAALAPSARAKEPRAKPLPDQDWVSLSQAGFEPITAGRFHVRSPDHPACAGMVDLVIPAGLAFGTGQHATTAGCLVALDALKRRGRVFRNILDLGTGTGLLAFGAAKLWPTARIAASDIDSVSIQVVRENAALNGIRRLNLSVADGMADRALVAAAPYDLVIANILAQPLIDMAAQIAASVARGGTLVLAGLLDTQAAAVTRAYRQQGMRPVSASDGEWTILVLQQRR